MIFKKLSLFTIFLLLTCVSLFGCSTLSSYVSQNSAFNDSQSSAFDVFLEQYTREAELGDADKMYNLGTLLLKGKVTDDMILDFTSKTGEPSNVITSVSINKDSAKYWLEKASQHNHDKAKILLAYLKIQDLEISDTELKNLFNIVLNDSKTNDPISLSVLGVMYFEGFGTKKSYSKAIDCFEKSSQENLSTHYLGLAYYYGYGVKKDKESGLNYLKLAANRNNMESLLTLSKIYLDKKGGEYDFYQAIIYALSAANLGNLEGAYIATNIVNEHPELDYKYLGSINNLLKQLSNSPNTQAKIFANKYLGILSQRFGYTPKDCLTYFSNAATLGDQESIKFLNKIKQKSSSLIKKANTGNKQAGKEVMFAFFTLNEMSFISPMDAIAIINKLAEKGDAEALYALSKLHMQGQYLPQDTNRALGLLQASANLGYQPAVNDINTYLSQVRQAEAQRQAAIEQQRREIAQEQQRQQFFRRLQEFSNSISDGVRRQTEDIYKIMQLNKTYYSNCNIVGNSVSCITY